MSATATTARTVAPFEGFGRELLWAGSDFSTGVMLTIRDGVQTTRVVRPGKGDYLEVDLHAATQGNAPVFQSGGTEPVAYLGVHPVYGVSVTDPSWTDTVNGWSHEWTTYPNTVTALVDLAFLHCS